VWKLDGGQWRMHRVLSYDTARYPTLRHPLALPLSPSTLAAYAGRYRSSRIGDILVSVEGDHLKLKAGSFAATLHPETRTRFFAVERDIRFEFESNVDGEVQALAVYENGAVSERASRAGSD